MAGLIAGEIGFILFAGSLKELIRCLGRGDGARNNRRRCYNTDP